jgi:hypothetical protein
MFCRACPLDYSDCSAKYLHDAITLGCVPVVEEFIRGGAKLSDEETCTMRMSNIELQKLKEIWLMVCKEKLLQGLPRLHADEIGVVFDMMAPQELDEILELLQRA